MFFRHPDSPTEPHTMTKLSSGGIAPTALTVLFFLPASSNTATILDWTTWDSTWVSGDLDPQVLNQPSQTIIYNGSIPDGLFCQELLVY